jgi:ribosomal protein S18 acetylase RimI-like enzyme
MSSTQLAGSIQFRRADHNDLEEILRHRRGMFHDMGFTDQSTLNAVAESSREFIRRGLQQGWYRGWFAVAGGRVVAGAGLLITDWVAHPLSPHDPRRAYVLNVYTDPEFRQRGLAKQLMRTIIETCRSEGFRAVWLHASEHGRPIYSSLGFEPTNEMKLVLL